jgi:hypothetical protein
LSAPQQRPNSPRETSEGYAAGVAKTSWRQRDQTIRWDREKPTAASWANLLGDGDSKQTVITATTLPSPPRPGE